MHQEIKDQWVSDLESGRFKKGVGRLHKVRATYDYSKPQGDEPFTRTVHHEFCCLGVLCEQAVAAGVVERKLVGEEESGHYEYFAPGSDESFDDYLPPVVRDWAGLSDASPILDATGAEGVGCSSVTCGCVENMSLVMLNDETFPDDFGPIAELIKDRLET